jgi:SAM-dependent methyltransferase
MNPAEGYPQETAFVTKEADAYFERNAPATLVPAPPDHRVLSTLQRIGLPKRGVLIDVGGGAGQLAAGFLEVYPGWSAKVIEVSRRAIDAGKKAFPTIEFREGSITEADNLAFEPADLVLVCGGVFCWVERALLSRAVSNVDLICRNSGLLAIGDFDSPFPRANPYKHHQGLFTFKQDYAGIFQALGTYTLLSRESTSLVGCTGSDERDPYDQQWVTSILKKDLTGRYYQAPLF